MLGGVRGCHVLGGARGCHVLGGVRGCHVLGGVRGCHVAMMTSKGVRTREGWCKPKGVVARQCAAPGRRLSYS